MLQLRKILHNKQYAKEDGLTMLELLTTIAILGIVTAIASPVIISMIQQAQIDAYKGEMSYVSDSTYKMINGTFGQPSLASAQITSDGEAISLESLGPSVDPDTGATLANSTNGYWYDISKMSVPFDAEDPSASIIWDNSRIVRVVPLQENGSFITDPDNQVIADACITAWVGDRNLVVESVKSSNVTEDNSTPCGLIPGPIEEPEAPSAPQSLEPSGDGETSELTASLIDPPDNLGADSEDISIESYRVTCTDLTNGGTSEATSATNTVGGFSPELTRGADYSCTAAITTNAYPGFSPESAPSATIRIPEAPGAPTELDGKDGSSINLGWVAPTDDGCNEPGVDDGNNCGDSYQISDYEVQYVLGIKDGTPTGSDFESADTLTVGSANITYVLSDANINDYNTSNGTSFAELENGSTYYIRTRAVNSVGLEGDWSNYISNQTATEPDAITGATGEDGNNEVSVDFTIPYDGGLPIDNIEIWYDQNNTYDSWEGVDEKPSYLAPDGENYKVYGQYDICTFIDPKTGEQRIDPDTGELYLCNLELQESSVDSKAVLESQGPPEIETNRKAPAYICDKGLLVWSFAYDKEEEEKIWKWVGDCDDVNLVLGQLPDSTSYFFKIFTENSLEIPGDPNAHMSDWSNEVPVATNAPADSPTSTDATIDDDGNATVEWQ